MRTYAGSTLLIISCGLGLCVSVVWTLTCAPTWANGKEEPKPYLDTEAYEVYAAQLPQEWPWSEAHAKQLVIQKETTGYPRFGRGDACLPSGGDFSESWNEVLDDYKKQNEMTKILARGFAIDKPYNLIPKQEFDDLFKKDGPGWDGFYVRHADSGGIIHLSAVGFNKDKGRAMLYAGHSCGLLCGGGGYAFFEKKEGKWVRAIVKGMSCSWAS
jgi:hypothetical protein